MSAPLQFYFDFLSPYAYLAHQRLPGLAARYDRDIDYQPVDLDTLKQLAGNTGPPTREIPAKLKYARSDMGRWAARYGVPLHPPAGYGSTRLNCGTFFALKRQQTKDYVTVAWDEVWGHGGDMADKGLLSAVAETLGWDVAEFLAFTVSDEALCRYAANTQRAHEKGVFGVPMMVLDGEMWWGNDRLDFVEDALRGKGH